MTTDIAIETFIECCADPYYNDQRKLAVQTQYNRNTWEFDHPGMGKIRIDTDKLKITVFPIVSYARDAFMSGPFVGTLSMAEAQHLKNLFFGKYKVDNEYMKKLQPTKKSQSNIYGKKLWKEMETLQADSFIGEGIGEGPPADLKMIIDNSIRAHRACIQFLIKFKKDHRIK